MTELFLRIVNMSLSASWLILIVLLLRLLLHRAPKWVPVLLWGIVAVRLICPISPESTWSLIPAAECIPDTVLSGSDLYIQSGIAPVDQMVNGYLADWYLEADTASTAEGRGMLSYMSIAWAVGIFILLLYIAFSYFRLHRPLRTAVRLRDTIYQSEYVLSPFVLGVLHPKIYLPFRLDAKNLQYVIAHERAHIGRGDHLWKPLGFLILCVHWFNPLVWLAYSFLCRDIELACDERVIRTLEHAERADYSAALLACSMHRNTVAACPLAFGEVGVKERVRSVLNYKKPTFWVVTLSLVLCVATGICFLTNPKTKEEIPMTLPMSFGMGDVDGDGRTETFRVLEEEENMLYRLEVLKADGSVLYSEVAGLPHAGWNSLFLCHLKNKDYLLRYNPTMAQGDAEYSYTLFSLENGQVDSIESDSVRFSVNPGQTPTAEKKAEMDAFAKRVNALLSNSTVLLSTNEGTLVYGGGSAKAFFEDFSVLEDE